MGEKLYICIKCVYMYYCEFCLEREKEREREREREREIMRDFNS